MTTNNKIDLNTCVPGQNLERRDGTLVSYERKFKFSTDYPHLIDGESYTNDGYYRLSRTEDSWDIVKILPIEKSKPVTDLRTCVRGQKLRLRDGRIVTYKRETGSSEYPHQTCSGGTYTDEGYYWLDKARANSDVIEILPLEKESKPVTDLRTCVPGQKVRLRYGAIVTYQRATDCAEYPHRFCGAQTYTDEGYYSLDKAESDNDVMEILPMEEEPVKTEPELTHSITDQIDVTSPDHVSIIPHEHGVTISIKKGNTTINWRHSNS